MKFHIVVIGRLKSTRLPKKALLPLGSNETISSFLMLRLSDYFASYKNIFVTFITSNLPSDAPLASYIQSLGYRVFCGHPENVIDRILHADQSFQSPSDFFIRVTSDNPFTCPIHILSLIHLVSSMPSVDYAVHPDLNTGFRSELISCKYLKQLQNSVVNPNSSEYLSYMLDRPDLASVKYLEPDIPPDLRKYSFTVDTASQYNFVHDIVTSGCSPTSPWNLVLDKAISHHTPYFDSIRYKRVAMSELINFKCHWKCDLL